MESTSRLFATSPSASSQDEPTDEDALVEAARHDPAAFAALYQRYFARVYRYLRIRLQLEEDTADLAQQVFLKALDALPRYQSRNAPFAAWLFAIARHALADRFRRSPVTLPLEAAGHVLADHEMEAAVLRRESIEQLTTLLGSLNSDARDLLALRFAAGLTTPEIAAILGKRPETVRKALSRLLQSLKEQYHAPH
ncbi:MAG TPA: sigma-70 family RNA polymerase sigma factor [Ktedonobacterales bacterium]